MEENERYSIGPLHWPTNKFSFRVRGNSLSRQCGTQTHFLWNKCKENNFSHHKTTTHFSFTALRLSVRFPLLVSSASNSFFLQQWRLTQCRFSSLPLLEPVHPHDEEVCWQLGSNWVDGASDLSSIITVFPAPITSNSNLLAHVLSELSLSNGVWGGTFVCQQRNEEKHCCQSQHLAITVKKMWLVYCPWILKTVLSVNGASDSEREKTQVAGFL